MLIEGKKIIYIVLSFLIKSKRIISFLDTNYLDKELV